MISFCKPCLNWKYIVGVKNHWGWNGFATPYATKYLHLKSRIQREIFSVGAYRLFTIENDEWSFGRFTGQITPSPANGNPAPSEVPFPYYEDTSAAVSVTDTYIKIIDYNYDRSVRRTREAWLTEEYTIPEVEADCDGFIAKVDPDSVAWRDLRAVGDLDLGPQDPFIVILGLIPSPLADSIWVLHGPIPAIGTSAFSIYIPTTTPFDDCLPLGVWSPAEPGLLIKMVGYVKMAGNYCEKTFYVDYCGRPKSHDCRSGAGDCAKPFQVLPPPIVVGQTGYKIIVPNCQCS